MRGQDAEEFLQALREFEGGRREHILELEEGEAAKQQGDVMCVGHQIIPESGPLQEQVCP